MAANRERQAAYDVGEAMARDLSASIFVGELARVMWWRLALAADVADELAAPA